MADNKFSKFWNKTLETYYKVKNKVSNYFSKSTETTFNWIYFAGSMIISAFAFYFGLTYLQILSMALLKVAIYFISLSGFVKFLYKVKFDILEEIFIQHNTSAGVFLAGLAIGLAIVISVAV